MKPKRKPSKYTKNKKALFHTKHPQKRKYNPSTAKRLRYKIKKSVRVLHYRQNRPLIYGMIWVLFIFFGLTTLEYHFSDMIMNIGALFIIISFLLGVYCAYPVVMWIDRKIPKTNFGLWMRRIVAGALVFVGAAMVCVWLLSASLAMLTLGIEHQGQGPFITMMTLSVFVASFFVGLSIFAGYMEFKFEREAGVLVFHSHQRF
ncbi:hypothetical protein ACK11Z_03900 [Methanoculleus bourgensis]|jgi:4-hydroxybenzoate polyprenyltransferase|uniref:hypothetical protein n=1 Tax=Methanoculleus bourgensis TaxID=83986 RepID=UPI0016BB1BF2|nr:hypothetical protein [Methanomicrobiales archaeon]